jgi:glutamate synthase domain-containing protein 3
LADWPKWSTRFVKVMPKEYKRALGELAAKRATAAKPAQKAA